MSTDPMRDALQNLVNRGVLVPDNDHEPAEIACGQCGKPATCTGLYEGGRSALKCKRNECAPRLTLCSDSVDKPACDDCCDHVNSKFVGHCHKIRSTKMEPTTDSSTDPEMPEADARKALEGIHTAELDEVRAMVRTERTSTLIGNVAAPDELFARLFPRGVKDDDEHRLIAAAALLAICDEIDRRIPVPA